MGFIEQTPFKLTLSVNLKQALSSRSSDQHFESTIRDTNCNGFRGRPCQT